MPQFILILRSNNPPYDVTQQRVYDEPNYPTPGSIPPGSRAPDKFPRTWRVDDLTRNYSHRLLDQPNLIQTKRTTIQAWHLRQKQAYDSKKAIQQAQRGKRKALQSTAPSKKQRCGAVAAYRERFLTPEAKQSRSGRKIVPKKQWEAAD
ncbi:hypothetical protein EJ07DRAFT_156476 [Lizonia empirigonia]|nr:hypothetical protein EJ07DRAFT_156476 [Lizonia empirigonia]